MFLYFDITDILYVFLCKEPPFIFNLTRQSFSKFAFLGIHSLKQTTFNSKMSLDARTSGARPCYHK